MVSASTDFQLIDVIQSIKARYYEVVFIGVDRSTFGSGESNEELINQMRATGIDAVRMVYGDSSEKLSQ